jgi:hypothetical protein
MVLECAQAAAAQETIAVFNSPMELHCLGGGKRRLSPPLGGGVRPSGKETPGLRVY